MARVGGPGARLSLSRGAHELILYDPALMARVSITFLPDCIVGLSTGFVGDFLPRTIARKSSRGSVPRVGPTRSRDFWLISGGYFVCRATTNGLSGTHLIAACVDHGLSEVAGAGLLATTGVFALLGGG